MANLIRRRTSAVMDPWRELDRWIDEAFRTWAPLRWPFSDGAPVEPALDVYREDGRLVVKAAVPDVDPKDVRVTLRGNHLTIEGEVRHDDERKERDYMVRERRSGAFRRDVVLPDGIDADRAEAVYDRGVLTLTFPESGATGPRRLEIKTTDGQARGKGRKAA